jgi:hypothetical protein
MIMGSLLVLLALLSCGSNDAVTGPTAVLEAPARVERRTWRDDRKDLLNWFLGHRPEGTPALYSDKAGHVLSLSWDGTSGSGGAYYAKWPAAWQLHRWDAVNVYLTEDWSGGLHGNRAAYSLSRLVWLPRRANPGDRGRNAGNRITWYDAACAVVAGPEPFESEWMFEGFERHDFGGVVGEADAAVVRYIWGPGREERSFYTWTWGWVRWQYVIDGAVLYDFTFNKPGAAVAPGAECSR